MVIFGFIVINQFVVWFLRVRGINDYQIKVFTSEEGVLF
jgi:hypothetical protein